MKTKCIGILGGGQLARMSALQAIRMGFDVAIWESFFDSPAGQLTKNEFVGSIDDNALLAKFAKSVDVITLESEFIAEERLLFLESLGKIVIPSPKTLLFIQDKFIQKSTFALAQIPVPDFIQIDSSNSFSDILEVLGIPFIIKSRRMGYDGYGNAKVSDEIEYNSAIEKLSKRGGGLMAEKFVDFRKEIAVMVASNTYQTVVYPLVETIQENHICKIVIAPVEIKPEVAQKAKEIASNAVKAIEGIGLFGVELFITEADEILLNEIAPRPHNSGHYSIEGCITSQFENHIRAVLNLPLGSAELIYPYTIMINLLGRENCGGAILNYEELIAGNNVKIHLYGKKDSRKGRKMGHLTLSGNNRKEVLNQALEIERKIKLG